MDRNDASALTDLQMHWGEAYAIGLDGDIWSARFRASTDELRAHTCTELREFIRSDYAYRQKAGLVTHEPGEPESDEAGPEEDPGGADENDRAAALVREHAERVNFAAIRGERMST